jgi:hypothetical protein
MAQGLARTTIGIENTATAAVSGTSTHSQHLHTLHICMMYTSAYMVHTLSHM